MKRFAVLVLASAALLNGCHRDQKATGHGTVSGKILPGTVTDDMLPYDSVKSKAPLAPVETVGRADNTSADAAADTATTPEPTVAASASTPTPEVPQN